MWMISRCHIKIMGNNNIGKIHIKDIWELESEKAQILKYLGMRLDCSTNGQVKVLMASYIQNTISTFPKAINDSAATPAKDYLFHVRD